MISHIDSLHILNIHVYRNQLIKIYPHFFILKFYWRCV